MSERFRMRAFSARSKRTGGLIALLALALAGCGSNAATQSASHSSTRSVASTPTHSSRPRVKPAHRASSARGTPKAATQVASAPCPAGEKRTATGLCYSPAAQATLVARLGPCLAGQVVADNGACQPVRSGVPTNQPTLPRCRRPHGAGCTAPGPLQGGGLKNPPGPGFNGLYH